MKQQICQSNSKSLHLTAQSFLLSHMDGGSHILQLRVGMGGSTQAA